jgi:hypothetical protein
MDGWMDGWLVGWLVRVRMTSTLHTYDTGQPVGDEWSEEKTWESICHRICVQMAQANRYALVNVLVVGGGGVKA